ncbi:MAG TPA: SPOR domain-containing protein [Thermoanaerobaculia bacterium]|nr:SPOR domain-containing protein [Thermoanaerobaculia bacterium]
MEPRTHYQVSFTARQALLLFIGLLAILGLSYFFGLMTGLSGNEPPPSGAVAAEETPPAGAEAAPSAEAGDQLSFPAPVTAVASAGGPALAPPAKVHVFEDGEAGAPPPPVAAAAATPRPRPAAGGFRVQVLSVSSRADAEGEAARLTRSGLPASVEPGTGPRGTVYRVRVGPFSTRQEAEEASRRLSSQGRRDTWIVPPGQ